GTASGQIQSRRPRVASGSRVSGAVPALRTLGLAATYGGSGQNATPLTLRVASLGRRMRRHTDKWGRALAGGSGGSRGRALFKHRPARPAALYGASKSLKQEGEGGVIVSPRALRELRRGRLLLQPHGFEGLGWICVADDASDLPVADRPDPSGAALKLRRASLASPKDAEDR